MLIFTANSFFIRHSISIFIVFVGTNVLSLQDNQYKKVLIILLSLVEAYRDVAILQGATH